MNLVISMIRSNFNEDISVEYSSLDMEVFIDLLEQHRILPYAYKCLKQELEDEKICKLEEAFLHHHKKVKDSLIQLEEFVHIAHKDKLKFVLLKGVSLADRIYGDPYIRQSNDIDILVEEDDMLKADYIVKKMGYKQPSVIDYDTNRYILLDYPIMRLKHTNHFFEYFNFEFEVPMKIEIHKRLFFVNDLNIGDFLWHIKKVQLEGISVNVLEDEYSLIFLFINAYQNSETLYALQGECVLREYVDLYNFLNRIDLTFDWEKTKDLVKKLKAEKLVVQILHNLIELYGNPDFSKYFNLLGLKDITYDHEWDIPMSFTDKMFFSNERRINTVLLQKKRAFDSSKTRIYVNSPNSEKQFFHLKTIFDVDIRYSFDCCKKCFRIYIYLPEVVMNDVSNYMFQLTIYNNIDVNPYLYSILEIVYEDKLTSYLINTEILRDSNVLRKNNKGKKRDCTWYKSNKNTVIVAEVFYEDMQISSDEAVSNLAIAFNWFKYMQALTYHLVNPSPESLYESHPLFLQISEETT